MKLPEAFINRMKLQLNQEFTQFEQSFDLEIPNSIRINPKKITQTPDLEPVKWTKYGYYLPERPIYTLDPKYHSGAYYVQEASSMVIEQVINQISLGKNLDEANVLDLCASPGGKSTHLLSLLPESAFFIANETVKTRRSMLIENIVKWGNPNAFVTGNTTSEFAAFGEFFDIILVDAPCSGEGMMRKDEYAVEQWSENLVRECSVRQNKIVWDIYDALKENGYLIYSTCTFAEEENEDNIIKFTEAMNLESIKLDFPVEWGITETYKNGCYGYRFYPHKTNGEGFFISLMKKNSSNNKKIKPLNKFAKTKSKFTSAKHTELLLEICPTDFGIYNDANEIYTMDKSHFEKFTSLQNYLYFISIPTNIGEYKGNNFIPSHQLALSNYLSKKPFNQISLEYTEALIFLKKEEIKRKFNEKSWCLFTYQDIPLGFAKLLEDRINNHYPSEWRIRMSIENAKENTQF